MDEQRVRGIRASLGSKSTEELQQVWAARDRGEWTPEALEIARQILAERGAPFEAVASESRPTSDKGHRVVPSGRRYKRNGAIVGLLAGIAIGAGKAALGTGSSDVLSDARMFSFIGALLGILGAFVGAVIQGYKGDEEP